MPEGIPLINVLSIDDDAVFQKQLRLLLLQDDIRLLPSAANLHEGVEFARSMRPDVILLDIWLDGESSLSRIAELRDASPSSHIIVLSLHQEPVYHQEAIRRGADAFVSKSDASEKLVPLVQGSMGQVN
ncbi:MAG: response regulator transcription factor [Rhodothermales bacterium]|nr:response regulator transcription factor [Rhodothermales bacterium]MBO6781107.1 response regulator transcription factor [Rhodothermales bacterium]